MTGTTQHPLPRIARACALAASLFLLPALAQTTAPAPAPDDTPTIEFTLPEQVEIGVLLDLAAEHLGLNLLYDEAVRGKQVSVRTASSVTPDELRAVLESALAMKQLVLVPTEAEGWFRVALASELVGLSAGLVTEDGELLADVPQTRVFRVTHADPQTARTLIEPFLSRPGGQVTLVPDTPVLLVTDTPRVIARAQSLIELIDVADAARVQRFITVQHGQASSLASRLQTLVNTAGATGTAERDTPRLEVVLDAPSNRLLLIGPEALVQRAEELAAELDVAVPTRTEVYTLSSLSPDRLNRLAEATLSGSDREVFRATVDTEGNALIVEATDGGHAQLDALIERLDVPTTVERNPVRFYRLQNAKADAVMQTIQALSPGALDAASFGGATPGPAPGLDDNAAGLPAGPRAVSLDLDGHAATVVPDEPTNSIIVIAPPAAQGVYEQLISQLDVRRPQVLIEVTIVTLDTSDGFSLGVELSRSTDTGDTGRVLTFSSFGLSGVDTSTGALSLASAGAGFTGALLEGNALDVVVRALQSDSRARVEAAPSILVNDNEEGSIESITEQPTTSINQGQNSDTVTFSDFVSAGTSITVTPTIAEGDHLGLEYQVELSSFDGASTGGIPAPRQTNTVSSYVTIPDGATIILGGLNRRNDRDSVTRVPILGSIPLVEYLFSNRSTESSESTLFVFIRATILRDDRFRDLRALSGERLPPAGLPDDYPTSEPLWIE